MIIVALWLIGIVGANLSIGYFGPEISILNAFLLIGLSLTTRDYLHDLWGEGYLKLKMGGLIACGGILSWITQPAYGGIAVASVTAFAISEIVDAIIYHRTKSINKSNAVSSMVDSILFPTIAFGGFPIAIILGQWAAKTFGGFLWSLVLNKGKLVKLGVLLLSVLGIKNVDAQITSAFVFEDENSNSYSTVEFFRPGSVEVFAFMDHNFDSPDVRYGEIVTHFNNGSIQPTIQLEFGDSSFFDIEEVVLAGARYKGIDFLLRSDDAVQLTYVWFKRFGNIQFNGFIDVWGWDNIQSIVQPQLWYNANDWLAVGGESFIRINESEFSSVEALGFKINKSW
jgi:hypothetical protein